LKDFEFLLIKMERMRESFKELLFRDGEKIRDLEALMTVGENIGDAYGVLLLKILGL
jgi:hypothetical protein